MSRLSREKIALIHVAKKELGWSEEVYRHVLRDHGGVDSAKDLDEMGFDRVIKHCKAMGFWITRKFTQERPRDAGDLPTPAQLKVIEHLWTDLAEFIPNAMLGQFKRGFMVKVLRLPPLGPQTRAQANKLIEVLKNRVQQETEKHVRKHAADEASDVPF